MSAGKGTKLVKGKVGKPKVKKLHLEETLPSLYGRRVVPTITQAMKTDASKKMTKKKKVTHFGFKMDYASLLKAQSVVFYDNFTHLIC